MMRFERAWASIGWLTAVLLVATGCTKSVPIGGQDGPLSDGDIRDEDGGAAPDGGGDVRDGGRAPVDSGSSCPAQDARGVGECLALFGYKWDGSACTEVGGCSCEGSDCDALYETADECEAASGSCGGSDEGECRVGGCSGQLCYDPEKSDGVSTCEWVPEYACYEHALCERQAEGNCGWTSTEAFETCLEDVGDGSGTDTCGGESGETCGDGEWCDYPEGSRCGGDDRLGECTPRPETCDDVYDPVCGCDGRTHANECEAHAAGIDVLHEGECDDGRVGETCGTRGAESCADDEWCDYVEGSMCGAADEGGECKKRPEACTDIYAPVCGCDGRTHGNACYANAAGVDVLHEGECDDA